MGNALLTVAIAVEMPRNGRKRFTSSHSLLSDQAVELVVNQSTCQCRVLRRLNCLLHRARMPPGSYALPMYAYTPYKYKFLRNYSNKPLAGFFSRINLGVFKELFTKLIRSHLIT